MANFIFVVHYEKISQRKKRGEVGRRGMKMHAIEKRCYIFTTLKIKIYDKNDVIIANQSQNEFEKNSHTVILIKFILILLRTIKIVSIVLKELKSNFVII